MTFLFYFEAYKATFLISLTFLIINLTGASFLAIINIDSAFGLNYTLAAAAASSLGLKHVFQEVRVIDRKIFI